MEERTQSTRKHMGPWTDQQKARDYDSSHLSLCAKYAAASLETPHFAAHNAKCPFVALNCMGHLDFASEDDLLQAVLEMHDNFFGPAQVFTVLAGPNSCPSSAIGAMTKFKHPTQDVPFFTHRALPYMTLDTKMNPYIAPQFGDGHPANSLRLIEVGQDHKSCEDYTTITFASFYAGTPTQAMVDEHKEKVKHVKRNVAPFFHSFVAYDGDQPVAAGCCLLCPTTGVAGIFEIGCAPAVRSKGYGAKLFSHIVEFIIAAGYTRACLCASEKGRPVYERQGFRCVGDACIHFLTHKS